MAETSAYRVLNTSKYYCTLRLSEYNRPDPFDTGYFKPSTTIRLPLPQELRDDTPVAYNNVDTQLTGDIVNGDIGAALPAEALRQVGQLGASTIGAGAAVIGGMAGETKSLGAGLLGRAVEGGLKNAFSADQIGATIQSKMGVAPNPNPTVILQGPQLREIPLSWTFMPTTEQDSKTIRRMIQTLKRDSLPGNSFENQASVLRYPKLCMVNFYPWDSKGTGRHGWGKDTIIKMKPAFMSAVNVNYTSGNMPAFFSGWNNEPVVIQLTITFKEVEYFLSNDYGGRNGGAIGDIFEEIAAAAGVLASAVGLDSLFGGGDEQTPSDDTANETQDAAET
jgi:hypothetical protein